MNRPKCIGLRTSVGVIAIAALLVLALLLAGCGAGGGPGNGDSQGLTVNLTGLEATDLTGEQQVVVSGLPLTSEAPEGAE